MYPVKEVETTSPNTSFHAAPRTCVRGWPPQIVHAGSQVKGGGHASAALSVGSRRVVNNRDVMCNEFRFRVGVAITRVRVEAAHLPGMAGRSWDVSSLSSAHRC